MEEAKKKVTWKRVVLTVVCVILALILAALIFVTAYIENLMNQLGRPDDSTLSSGQIDDILNEGGTLNPDDLHWNNDPDYIIDGKHIINIMLIGQDRREGQGRQRSDSMILCTINTKTKTLTMTSFMRDMYVPIPGYREAKINACYQIGGMQLLDKCLEKNFGVYVDGNIEVDFNGFMDIIDLIGGVELELTATEANYLNARGNWDVTEGDNWSLKPGVNKMNGSQALAYSRIRYITSSDSTGRPDSDFGRTYRQRKVLTAIMEKAKTQPLNKLNDMAQAVVKLVTTDMENKEILSYITNLLPLLGELEIVTLRIPADGAYSEATLSDGDQVIVPDLKKNQQLLVEALTD
ncbi:MAG: LCP family protein [Oscillospiraceae bacterium]|nr:LCP family protein [Oscillospiraceae bacterium]